MSSITSLSSIDKQKYAIIFLLNNIGIDIDTDDGHLYYQDNATCCIELNGKILRIDSIGRPVRGVMYSSFNPITREDHAQLLMQFVLQSMMLAGDIDKDECDNFEVKTNINYGEKLTEDQTLYEVEITNKDDNILGAGYHDDECIATCLAVIDYMKNSKYVEEILCAKCGAAIIAAYEESERLKNLNGKDRRAEMRERKRMLYEGNADDDPLIYGDSPEETEIIEPEEIHYEDDPETDEIEFSDNDFEQEDDFNESEEEDNQFIMDNFECEVVNNEPENNELHKVVTEETTPEEETPINNTDPNDIIYGDESYGFNNGGFSMNSMNEYIPDEQPQFVQEEQIQKPYDPNNPYQNYHVGI